MSVRIGIMGYGNLGRGVEYAVSQSSDLTLAAVFTRRNPASLEIMTKDVPVYAAADAPGHAEDIDVMILCGGSANDLPEQTPLLAKYFNVVDSFDTHAKIPEHFSAVHKAASEGGKTAIISVGWDPGLFSLMRMYGAAALPRGSDYTFWGKGVSQGHSDAVRRVEGVLDARQYTIPVDSALERVRNGENPVLSTREKHTRECFVVAEEGADRARIERDIKTMPNYFADYDTTVHFITKEELERDHKGIPHGGFVIRSGETGDGSSHVMEFSLKLQSNPAFTSSVLASFARAAARLNTEGSCGCKTIFDIPPAYLCSQSGEELRKHLL